MYKLVSVVGARPQIIKAAAISREIQNSWTSVFKETILHTGQHYDENMSDVFFREMQIPNPAVNLEVGSSTHGRQTALMLEGIEKVLLNEKPDAVLVYGDTNSTLAGALAAVKIHIPVIHIEAGLRSFNKRMPEEINRIAADHMSTLLFTPTQAGIVNLKKEGFSIHTASPWTTDKPGVFHCGDVMYDNTLFYLKLAENKSTLLRQLGVTSEAFFLGTLHRDTNTDDENRLNYLFEAFLQIVKISGRKFILPLHPRTRNLLDKHLNKTLLKEVRDTALLQIIPPVSFFDMLVLEKHCRMIFTDSGGVQKESYFFQKPCVILRDETEWVEIVQQGSAIICGSDPQKIIQAYLSFESNKPSQFPSIFGDGNAAAFICSRIEEMLKSC